MFFETVFSEQHSIFYKTNYYNTSFWHKVLAPQLKLFFRSLPLSKVCFILVISNYNISF